MEENLDLLAVAIVGKMAAQENRPVPGVDILDSFVVVQKNQLALPADIPDAIVRSEATRAASPADSLDSTVAAIAVKMTDLGSLPAPVVDSFQVKEVGMEGSCY
ncbi:MAG TPA: hypothetical protein VFA09_25865 [Ktedonobacteraceae bacterium]|nr:hypothetical protein [Ktedonobacteraceae bacterium]